MPQDILSELRRLESQPGRYYVQRPLVAQPDYEDAYWGTITDPDGKVRDRLAERESFLVNTKAEADFIRSRPPGRILDVGCGLGFFLSAVDDTWERHGTELSAFAGKHASQWGKIFVGDLPDAQYPAAYFDLVVMHHVIEHILEPEAAIAEIHRILKPGGILVLGTPDFDSGCARRFGEKYRLLSDATHVSLFSNDSMHRFLRDHGFVIDSVDYPYFDTPYFTTQNLSRLFNLSEISPPFYGNFMTFYCHKPADGERVPLLPTQEVERAAKLLRERHGSGRVLICADENAAGTVRDFINECRPGYQIELVSAVSELGSGPAVLLAFHGAEMRDVIAAARDRGMETAVFDLSESSSPKVARAKQALILACLSEQMAQPVPQLAE